MTAAVAPRYDPYDVAINADPYPHWKRLRDEAPLYYDEQHDFYALSRHQDVERALVNWGSFSSARSPILELIQANIEFPAGIVLFEDPPIHDLHRGLLSRVFTPRRMSALEPQIRELCVEALDPHVGTGELDFITHLGKFMPMRVIGMLLGIPEEDQAAIRDRADANIRVRAGEKMHVGEAQLDIGIEMFTEYIEWRAKHPSDDLMTSLLTAEFEDETGTTRRLTREEVLTYVTVVAGAGNETTTRLIGWAGKVLADFPHERRKLVEDPSLIPNAIEELLRFEPPAPHAARYVTQDLEYHGQTVPEGSAMLLLMGSANRDERKFEDPDQFDVHREVRGHIAFGFGLHYCLGANLARLEGRVALEEVLKRFPEWTVDMSRAEALAHLDGSGLGHPPREHPVSNELDGKVAIVTGGANGIGRAITQVFVEEGAQVVIADLDDAAAGEVVGAAGAAASFVHTDVSDANSVQAAIDHARERFGALHIMVNNAGISGSSRRLMQDDLRDFERVMGVDLYGVMVGTQRAARAMGPGGSIINVTSIAGINPGPGFSSYRAAKAGVIHFSRSAAIEVGELGIRVNVIAPGNIATAINASLYDTGAVARRLQPLHRTGDTRDVANTAVYLASERSAQVTGSLIPVDGGTSAGPPPISWDDIKPGEEGARSR